MDEIEASSERVAVAVADALKNEALQEAVLVFGSTRILLTKSQRISVADPADADALPEYPAVETNLVDDASSWFS